MSEFKIRCTEVQKCQWYTKDKIYDVVNGLITIDTGDIHDFETLRNSKFATWELVEDTDTNVENIVISPNETICKLENEIARLTEKARKTQENNENVIMELTIERDNMQKALGEKDTEIEDLKKAREKHTELFAKLYQEKEEQDKILKEKNDLIVSYRDDIAELKSQLPKEKTIKDELDEIERDLLKVQQAVEMKEASYNQGYKQGIEDMHKHLRQTLKFKGIE